MGRKWYQKRNWCLYLVSFVIISCFFCHLLATNKRNIAELINLKEDLQVLSVNLIILSFIIHYQPNCLQIALKQLMRNPNGRSGNIEGRSLGIPGVSDGSLSGCNCRSQRLNSYVDSIIKQTLSSFMDDIYNITHIASNWP